MAAVGDASVAVRPAAPADVPALGELVRELGYAGSVDDIAGRLARILADDGHALFVAERAGDVVGWLQVQLTNILESDARGEIVGLVVTAAHRRQGVGQRLVQEAEAWTRSRGVGGIGVRCNETRGEAHRFYQRLGFAFAKTQLSFRKKL